MTLDGELALIESGLLLDAPTTVAGLAIGHFGAGVIGFSAELFNTTLRENREEIAGWFAWARPVTNHLSGFSGRLRPAVVIAAFLVLRGLFASLLDPGFPRAPYSGRLLAGTLVGVLVVTGVALLPLFCYVRIRHGEWGWLRPVGTGVLVALGGLVMSRLLRFQPGYIYGLTLAKIWRSPLTTKNYGHMHLACYTSLLVVSALAFAARFPLATALAAPDHSAFLDFLDIVLVVVIVAGVEGVAFALVPLRFLDGAAMLRWSRLAWGALWGAGTFAFVHVILHPGLGFWREGSAVMVLGLFLGFAALSVAFWARFRFRRRPQLAGWIPY